MDCSWFSDKEQRLKCFPHSFQLSSLQCVNDKKRRSILDRLTLEPQTEKMSLMEENRNDNFASFLLFLLNEKVQAINFNAGVLRRDKNNIVARANLVQFLSKTDLLSAEENLKQLENIKTDSSYDRMHAVAEAELAFCLASTSPFCYLEAAARYRSVNEKYPEDYLWKFGEALTLRRCVTLNSYSKGSESDIIRNAVRCSELLHKITAEAPKDLKAKAWVQLGDLNVLMKKAYPPFNHAIVDQVIRQTDCPSPESCFRFALEECDNDAFVLERCGRYYRNIGHEYKSKTLLEKAIDIRPTSFSYQHLAMTLMKIAKMRCPPASKHKRRHFSVSKDDPLIQSSIYNLQKSVDITHGCNISALDTLGRYYLQLEAYNNAEDTYMKIINSHENGAPGFTIHAFEEMGLLCLRKSEQAGLSQPDRSELMKQSKFYLMSSIETAARHVSQVVSLQMTSCISRDAFQTITDMLRNEYSTSRNPTHLKEMARLYELIGKHKTSLDIYKKLCEDPKEAANPEISIRLIDNYLRTEDYDNARLCLSLLLCTRQAPDVSNDLVNRVYLETARHILVRGDQPQLAHDCFKRAFEFRHGPRKEGEADDFDILILHDDDDSDICETSTNIQNILQTNTGLGVTRNIEASFCASRTEISSYEVLMTSVRTIIIILNADPPSRQLKFLIDMVISFVTNGNNRSVVCLTTGSTHSVTGLRNFRTARSPANDSDCKASTKWLFEVFPLLVDSDIKL